MNDFVTITTPDGRQVRFPKGMSREDMAAALNSLPPVDVTPEQPQAPTQPTEQKPFGQRAKEFFLGDDDPTTQNAGEKIGSFLNKAGEAMTFGLVGDEASAAVESVLPGVSYEGRRDHYRQQEAQFEKTNPGAALGADIGGSLVGMLLPGGMIGAAGRGAGMGARLGASAAAGAGMGGTYGFMEGEGLDDRFRGAQVGGGLGLAAGAAAPVIGAGVNKVANSLMQRGPRKAAIASAKSAADLRGASGRQYDIFEGADVQLKPGALARLRGDVTGRLNNAGATHIPGPMGKLDPNSQKIVDTLAAMDGQVSSASRQGLNPRVPLRAVDDVRKKAGQYAREVGPDFRPTNDARLAGQAVEQIDEFMDTLRASDIASGDAQAAHDAILKARELWRRSIKTQKVENAMGFAEDYLGGTESGLRNQIKSLLRKNAKDKLFTPDEEAALRKIIGNNMLSRAVRAVGDGLGRKLSMGGGFMAGGLEGAAVGAAASEVASRIGESTARKNAEIARALIASGGLQNLPVAPESLRLITEGLSRRIGAVGPQ